MNYIYKNSWYSFVFTYLIGKFKFEFDGDFNNAEQVHSILKIDQGRQKKQIKKN